MATNDAIINEILKNMTPEDAAQMGQAYQAQNSLAGLHTPTPEEANASMKQQLAAGNIPTTGSLGGMTLQQQPQGQQGPPAPVQIAAPAAPASTSPLASAMVSTRTPVDMGRLNPLGAVQKGSDGSSIDDILSKLQGQSNPALQAALNNRNQLQLFSLLGKATNQILGGQTHTKLNNDVYDALAKQGEQGVTDIGTQNDLVNQGLKQRQLAGQLADEAAKDDPTSSISALYRAAAEKTLHGKLPDNISASQLEKASPIFERIYQAEQNSLNRQAQIEMMNDFRNRSINNREDTAANQLFDKNTSQFSNRILGANRALDVLDQVKSGKITDTNSLYNALNSEITQLFMNVQSGGALADREEGRINSLKAQTARLAAYFGKPVSSIPSDFLPQIEQEINVLKGSYLTAYKQKSNELQAGTNIQGKKDVFNNRTNSFLGQQGINPNTLQQGPKAHPQDDQAIQWAKDNPGDPRSAAILKANGQ